MDRRNFVASMLAAVPVLSVIFTDATIVTVTHEGEKPVTLRIVGDVILPRGAGLKSYDKANPLTLPTPADFAVDLEKQPVIIEAQSGDIIRVVADHRVSSQHVLARARRVTIRGIPPKQAGEAMRIEITGESKVAS